ncbi:MAG: enoyl-CoA hydratase-related protein, partial [Acidimicrobiales bacterium]|nr:enoyl-CoA hydratase-related protein [Acidimicrobiales bacterium]
MTDSTDAVLIEHHDPGVLVVTFNRPETMNAFSSEMSAAFTTALRDADTDDSIRVVVVTGSGRAFCAGADFSKGSGAFATPTKETFSSDPLDPFHPWECRKPVIAAINGHAVGIGMTMTLQCDLRIVAEEAKLGIVQNRRGVLPDAHAHWTLPRLVGH